jgi:hypothetical protein
MRAAAMICGVGLVAFAAMWVADRTIGHTTPFMPGLVSAVVMAVWILLVRRYGPRGPVDPRRQRKWLVSGLAAAGALAALGFGAVFWMGQIRAVPSVACAAAASIEPVAVAGEAGRRVGRCDG